MPVEGVEWRALPATFAASEDKTFKGRLQYRRPWQWEERLLS